MTFSSEYIPGRVSVIIISYNYGHFIVHAIQSALSQNVNDLEIIVVDDGSTDGTYKIIKPYKNKIKYIFQNNAGQSAARNVGIENSTGEFIQFLDSDDILGAAKISTQINYFRSNPDAHIAVCLNKRFSKLTNDNKPKPQGAWLLFKKNLDTHLCYFNIAPPHAFLYRRNAVIKTGKFDSSVDNCEDYDFLLRAALQGFTPCYTPSCVVYYRQHEKSVTAHAVRQYLTDAAMHNRLSSYMDQFQTFPHGHRLEGLVAFAAGAIKTAERLSSSHPEKSHDLLRLALNKIRSAREIVDYQKTEWNFLMKLFCMKLLSSLVLPDVTNLPVVRAIRNNLFEILQLVNAPKTTCDLLFNTFISSMAIKEQWIFERFILAYLPLKYLLNRFFPSSNRIRLLK